jgi:hypothetical protein
MPPCDACATVHHAGPEGDAQDPDQELLEYMTRNRDVPIPTYFIGGFGGGR